MVKRKKLKVKNLLVFAFSLLLIILGIYLAVKFLFKKVNFLDVKTDGYIASTINTVKLYDTEFNESKEVARGLKVLVHDKKIKNEDETDQIEYLKIEVDNDSFLIDSKNIVKKYEDAVFEKTKYVRTSTTIYNNSDDVDIVGFAKKGAALQIEGFDKLNDDGSVNMYKISTDGINGYVYSKYLVDTEELALAVYNENGTYDFHKDRKYYYELYGGSSANLDYYPYQKPTFSDNKLLAESKTYYLVGTSYVLDEIDKYIDLAKNAGATAFVIDIKDGALAFQSEVAKKYSPSSYNAAMNSIEFYKSVIQKVKDAGLYAIGRIVLFNDSLYAKDHPEDCILDGNGKSTNWVSAYSRNAWVYNVKLAKEAIKLFDFNEIQFDYVRFPEASFNWSKNNYDFRNKYNEEKSQAVQNFLFYATDEIHKDNTYLSIDVFGECSGTYATAYGQYWPAISNIVDVVSAMPYTDHFDRTDSNYWTNPYNTVYKWGLTAAARQKEIPTPAKVRTWITAYDTPYWNVTNIYGANEISAQVRGLVDAGLGSGFITWNSKSSYSKYQTIAPAFSKEY